jgi:hypothetical protein
MKNITSKLLVLSAGIICTGALIGSDTQFQWGIVAFTTILSIRITLIDFKNESFFD